MTYLQIAPSPVLRPFVRALWYCRAPRVAHARERVLPNGCMQIILNLAGEYLTECAVKASQKLAPAIVVGARARFEVLDTADLAELAGIVVEPGGFAPLFGERADLFFEQSIALESVWARFRFLERMSEAGTAAGKLAVLDAMLRERVRDGVRRSPLVDGGIAFLKRPGACVSECARSAGVSERWLSRVFREEVGVSPKLWCRIRRFQDAVGDLHRGADVAWAELALRCGYYDQAHFINDFRGFSGINPTTYSVLRGRWQNHLPIDSLIDSDFSNR